MQPFYRPANNLRYTAPPGELTYVFHWGGLSRLFTNRIHTPEVATGITMPEVTALFEDRKGNLWIGGPRLQRWRDGIFLGHSTGFKSSALSRSGPVFMDSGGRVWFEPAHYGLYSIEHGTVTLSKAVGLARTSVTLSSCGFSLWIGRQKGGLTHLFAHANTLVSKTYTKANGLAQTASRRCRKVRMEPGGRAR